MTDWPMNYLEEIATRVATAADDTYVRGSAYQPLWLGYAVLALSKGITTTQEDVHNVWSLWAVLYHKDHRSLVPFDQLEPLVQELDEPYRQAIVEVAGQLAKEGPKALPKSQGVNPGWRKNW